MTTNSLDDNELFERIANDDDQLAYTLLYERYHQMVYSLALFYLKDKAQAEDTLQYAFMKLWEQRRALGFYSSIKNYLFTMTKHHVLNLIRNDRTAFEKNYEIAQELSTEEEFESAFFHQEQKFILLNAIKRLTPMQQRIIGYKLNEELNHPEIALRMSVSVNTVKTHYQLALKSLRRLLAKNILILLTLIYLFYS